MILRRAATYVVIVAMFAIGVAFLLAVLYMISGSLEFYPTEEQEEKVRLVTTISMVSLAFTEVLLWRLFKLLKNKDNKTSRSRPMRRDKAPFTPASWPCAAKYNI